MVAVTLGGAMALMVAKVGVMLVEGTVQGDPGSDGGRGGGDRAGGDTRWDN